MAKAFFVTGTDTGVGKTLVTSALLHQASERQLRCLGLKPIAAGGIDTEHGMRNEDALLLQQYASVKLPYEQVCPVSLAEPVSPHIAAEHAGKQLNLERIVGYCRGSMMTPHDICLIEGAGGWRVPIGPRALMSDLAKLLNLPVILVVGLRLGCLNHALLTAEAINSDGLPIAGWVGNLLDKDMLAIEENIATLQMRFPFPCLGHIPYLSNISAELLTAHLDISKLLQTTRP